MYTISVKMIKSALLVTDGFVSLRQKVLVKKLLKFAEVMDNDRILTCTVSRETKLP